MAGTARLNIGVSADAKQASESFRELAADIKKVGNESVGVTEGVARVDAALAKLASAPDAPGALAKAVAKARVEVEDLRAALERTPASAEKMAAIEQALARADAALEKATARAGRLRDATEEVGGRMQVTAKGAEALTGSFGSLQGILGKMADSTSATSQSMATLGFKALAVGEAFKFGHQTGTAFNKFLEDHGNYLAKAIDGTVNFVTGLKSEEELLQRLPATLNTVLRAKQQLTEETTKTLAGLRQEMGGWQDLDAVRQKALDQAKLISERYTQLKSSGGDWRTEVELQATAINATTNVLLKLGVDLASLPLGFQTAAKHAAEFELTLKAAENAARLAGAGVAGLRDALAEIPANLQDFNVTEVIDGLSKSIASAKAEGKDWNVVLDDYRKELDLVREAAYKAGAEGVELFRTKVLDLVPAVQAAEIATGGLSASTKRFLSDINAQVEAIEKYRAAVNELDIATSNWMERQQQASNLSGQTTGFLKAAEEQFRATGQAMYTMTIMQTEMTQATEAQIDALRRMDEQLNSTWDGSGAGQRALDQIAQMVDMFKAGVLSLDGFNKSFAYLEEQLDRVIKAGGDLDGSLAGVLEALRKIAAQVRQGPGGARQGGVPGY